MESSEIMKMCEETMPSPTGTLKLLFKQRPGETDEEFAERVVLATKAQGERQERASRNLDNLLKGSGKPQSDRGAKPQPSISNSFLEIQTTDRILWSAFLMVLRRLLTM